MEIVSEKVRIKDLLLWKRSNILSVNPEYQRGAVWSVDQQRKLIDSVFRGYPLPLIYLHYRKTSIAGITTEHLEIIDGQQRINALHAFAENHFKLFDPVLDEKRARFPEFIKKLPCQWAHCNYFSLPVNLKDYFEQTEVFIAKVITDEEDEARDLFIRLQSGLPLNPQEKRDAWPGGYTEFVLQTAGKKEIMRYPGHDFFRHLVYVPSTERGVARALCAQIGMLFFENATQGNWKDIGTQAIDDYYYQQLAFDPKAPKVQRFIKVLDLVATIFKDYNGKKLKAHEAIHVVLLVNSLMEDYAKDWQTRFVAAFDKFRHESVLSKKQREGEYWYYYVALISTQASQASTIQRRHSFFTRKMFEFIKPVAKDPIRGYGLLERELIFFRDQKICAVCGYEVNWLDLEIHHVNEHQHGGATTLENGVSVHKSCHPKGQAAVAFYEQWKTAQEKKSTEAEATQIESFSFDTALLNNLYQISHEAKGILASGKMTANNKFVILKGSVISSHVSDSFESAASAAFKRRQALIEDGTIDEHFTFTKDVTFNSKSNAASLVLGFSANGNTAWKPTLPDELQ